MIATSIFQEDPAGSDISLAPPGGRHAAAALFDSLIERWCSVLVALVVVTALAVSTWWVEGTLALKAIAVYVILVAVQFILDELRDPQPHSRLARLGETQPVLRRLATLQALHPMAAAWSMTGCMLVTSILFLFHLYLSTDYLHYRGESDALWLLMAFATCRVAQEGRRWHTLAALILSCACLIALEVVAGVVLIHSDWQALDPVASPVMVIVGAATAKVAWTVLLSLGLSEIARRLRGWRAAMAMLDNFSRTARSQFADSSPSRVLDDLVQRLHHAFGYPDVFVARVDPEDSAERPAITVIACAGAHAKGLQNTRLSFAQTGASHQDSIRRALKDKRAVRVDRLDHEPYRAIEQFPGTKSELVVPIWKGGIPIGVLAVMSPRRRAFSESDRAALEIAVANVGVTLQGAETAEVYRRLAARASAPDQLAQEISRQSRSWFGAPLAVVYVRDPVTGTIDGPFVDAASGILPSGVPLEESPTSVEDAIDRLDDVTLEDLPSAAIGRLSPLRSILGHGSDPGYRAKLTLTLRAPVGGDGIGIVRIFWLRCARNLAATDQRRIEEFGRAAATMLDAAFSRERGLLLERVRQLDELHAELRGTAHSIGTLGRHIQQRMDDGVATDTRGHLDNVVRMSTEIHEALGFVSKAWYQPVADDLPAALRGLREAVRYGYPWTDCVMDVPSHSCDISPALVAATRLIAERLLLDALRGCKAHRLELRLKVAAERNELQLFVSDDGVLTVAERKTLAGYRSVRRAVTNLRGWCDWVDRQEERCPIGLKLQLPLVMPSAFDNSSHIALKELG